MTESDRRILELKRKRPKTHWLWYIGTIVASLGVGLSIAYAIGQSQMGFDAKTKDNMDISVKFTPKENYKITTRIQPTVETVKTEETVESKVNSTTPTTPIAKAKAPNYQVLVKKSNHIEQHTSSNQKAKTKTTISKKRSEKPSFQPKPNHGEATDKTPPKTEKPPVSPNPVPEPTQPTNPDNQHKGPIIKIVDRVTNTVQYLLTGKTKNN